MKFNIRARFGKLFYSFSGPKATSLISALIILSFLSFGTTINEPSKNAQELLILSGIAFRSLFLALTYYVVVSWLIDKFAPAVTPIRALAILFLFGSTEIIRTIYVGHLAISAGLLSDLQLIFRLIAGGLTGIIIFGLNALIQNDNYNYKQNLYELERIKSELTHASDLTEEDIKSIRFKVLETLRSAINATLELVTSKSVNSTGNSKLVVNELVRISEEVVRPLSHKIFNDPFELPAKITSDAVSKISTRRVIELATSEKTFQPLPTSIVAGALLVGVVSFGAFDLATGLIGAFVFMVIYGSVLIFGKKYIQPYLNRHSIPLRIAVVSVVNLSMTFVIFSSGFFLKLFAVTSSVSAIFYFFILASIFTWMLALYPAIDTARAETLQSVKEINNKLTWINARLGAQLSAEQKYLASVVHRDVQGKLIATALKFQQDLAAGKTQAEANDELQTLVNSITELVIEPQQAATPAEVINGLNEVWGEIFKLKLEAADAVSARIANDAVCRQSISDIVGEFATNSVKHGKAKNGLIKIRLTSDSIIELAMHNDGEPLPEHIQPGLGAKLAAQQCLSVSSKNSIEKGVEFLATLPVP